MSIRPVGLRRPLALALAGLVALGAIGCGTAGHYVASGEIEVHNSILSFEFIDAVRVAEVGGPDVLFFDVFLIPGESLYVDGLYPGYYDVTVYWSDGTRTTYFDVDVDSYRTTLVIAQT